MGLRYETVAYPYLTVRRNIQEQQEGDMELIRYNDEANKRERVRRQIEAHTLELEHGVAPEQHGLRTPAIKGISEKEYERLADTVVVVPSEQYRTGDRRRIYQGGQQSGLRSDGDIQSNVNF